MSTTRVKSRFLPTAAIAAVLAAAGATAGCSTNEVAGGLLGGAAVGGAYEYSNKRALEDLREEYESGEITREEYERRRRDIEKRSIIY